MPDFSRQINGPLPSYHPCTGCQANCCDPVPTSMPIELPLPVYQGVRRVQKAPAHLINFFTKKASIPQITKSVHDFIDPILSGNAHFSLQGFAVRPDTAEMLFEKTVEGSIENFVVTFHQVMLAVLLKCSAFDKTHRICTDYEDRPEMCRTPMTPQTCQCSPLFSPSIAEKMAREQMSVTRSSRRLLREAIMDYMTGRRNPASFL